MAEIIIPKKMVRACVRSRLYPKKNLEKLDKAPLERSRSGGTTDYGNRLRTGLHYLFRCQVYLTH